MPLLGRNAQSVEHDAHSEWKSGDSWVDVPRPHTSVISNAATLGSDPGSFYSGSTAFAVDQGRGQWHPQQRYGPVVPWHQRLQKLFPWNDSHQHNSLLDHDNSGHGGSAHMSHVPSSLKHASFESQFMQTDVDRRCSAASNARSDVIDLSDVSAQLSTIKTCSDAQAGSAHDKPSPIPSTPTPGSHSRSFKQLKAASGQDMDDDVSSCTESDQQWVGRQDSHPISHTPSPALDVVPVMNHESREAARDDKDDVDAAIAANGSRQLHRLGGNRFITATAAPSPASADCQVSEDDTTDTSLQSCLFSRGALAAVRSTKPSAHIQSLLAPDQAASGDATGTHDHQQSFGLQEYEQVAPSVTGPEDSIDLHDAGIAAMHSKHVKGYPSCEHLCVSADTLVCNYDVLGVPAAGSTGKGMPVVGLTAKRTPFEHQEDLIASLEDSFIFSRGANHDKHAAGLSSAVPPPTLFTTGTLQEKNSWLGEQSWGDVESLSTPGSGCTPLKLLDPAGATGEIGSLMPTSSWFDDDCCQGTSVLSTPGRPSLAALDTPAATGEGLALMPNSSWVSGRRSWPGVESLSTPASRGGTPLSPLDTPGATGEGNLMPNSSWLHDPTWVGLETLGTSTTPPSPVNPPLDHPGATGEGATLMPTTRESSSNYVSDLLGSPAMSSARSFMEGGRLRPSLHSQAQYQGGLFQSRRGRSGVPPGGVDSMGTAAPPADQCTLANVGQLNASRAPHDPSAASALTGQQQAADQRSSIGDQSLMTGRGRWGSTTQDDNWTLAHYPADPRTYAYLHSQLYGGPSCSSTGDEDRSSSPKDDLSSLVSLGRSQTTDPGSSIRISSDSYGSAPYFSTTSTRRSAEQQPVGEAAGAKASSAVQEGSEPAASAGDHTNEQNTSQQSRHVSTLNGQGCDPSATAVVTAAGENSQGSGQHVMQYSRDGRGRTVLTCGTDVPCQVSG